MPTLVLQDAQIARDKISAQNQKHIRQLYLDWAKDVKKREEFYASKTNMSSQWQVQQMRELEKQMAAQAEAIAKQIETGAKDSMFTVADSVVGCNAKFLAELGFPVNDGNVAMTSIAPNVVNNIVTGQIYDSGWSLSAAIWGDNQKTLSDIYEIVAKGRTMNLSVYDVSKMLESYVNPSRTKIWNLKMSDGVKIYKRSVDYNAQRLVRTLNQHAYQQSVIAVVKENPFVSEIIWRANGSRACPLCISRDGTHYKWNEVPLDHPNGMCVMEPVTSSNEDITDMLADWVVSPDGTFPEMDKFAGQFGYVPQPTNTLDETQKKWLLAAGYTNNTMPKDFTEFAHKLDFDQQTELLKAAGGNWGDAHPFQKMEKYYNENIAKPGGTTNVKAAVGQKTGVEALGKSTGKTFNYWYTKLDADKKALAKQLKEESGLTWQQFYEKHIYSGAANVAKKAVAQSASGALNSVDDLAAAIANGGEEGWKKVADFLHKHNINIYDFVDDDDKFEKDFFLSVFPDANTKFFANKTDKADNAVFPSFSELKARAKKQTESKMLDMESKVFAKMGDAGKQGLRVYTGSAYTRMNGYLRYMAAGKTSDEAKYESGLSESDYRALMDAKKALSKATLSEDLVLRRGTDLGDLAGLLPGDFMTNFYKLQGMSVDELNARYAGTIGQYAGFTSTSSIWDRGFDGEVEVVFNAPKGTQACSVMSISKFGTGEGETLLNAGTKVRVVKIEESDRHMGSNIRIFMDILPQ